MKDAIKFVTPAFKAGPSLLETDHYIIRNGRICAFSRALAISAPLEGVPDCCPRADLFRAAMDKAGDAVGFDLKPDALHVRSKGLRVAVPCLAERPYEPLPQGDHSLAPSAMLDGLRAVSEWQATDDARRHVQAIHLQAGCYTATNNVGAIQHWTGHGVPRLTIPSVAVAALVRQKAGPIGLQISETDVTFHYEGGAWIKAAFWETEYPFDQIMSILDRHKGIPHKPIPEGFKEAVGRIAPFCAGDDFAKLYFRDGGIATHRERATGAHIEIAGLPEGLCVSLKLAQLLASHAEQVNWSDDLQHDFFKGTNVRGAIMGMRNA